MTERTTDTALDPMFLRRWSPRAFDGSPMPEADLLTILDAGRWAPSAFNVQPWRMLYTLKGDGNWERFLDLLLPFNAAWAEQASALVFMLSDRLTRMKPGADLEESYSHSFDAGAAWAQMALQAQMLGYHSHGMTGLDLPAARSVLQVPDRFRIEAAIAFGRLGEKSTLPEQLRQREGPSPRRPLGQLACRGPFTGLVDGETGE